MTGYIGHVSHCLGTIELVIFLCAFVCRVGYYDVESRETLLYK